MQRDRPETRLVGQWRTLEDVTVGTRCRGLRRADQMLHGGEVFHLEVAMEFWTESHGLKAALHRRVLLLLVGGIF
jgi:hypothetical protein